jgi:hypothetical protein
MYAICLALQFNFDTNDLELVKQNLLDFALVHGLDALTTEWKSMVTLLQDYYFQNELSEWKRSLKKLTKFQRKIFELITRFNPDLRLSKEEPELNEFWFVSHMSQTRSMAPPVEVTANQKLIEYLSNMTQKVGASEAEIKGAFALGEIIGDRVIGRKYKSKDNTPLFNETHLSLSGGSSFEYSRSAGGKWALLEPGEPLYEFLMEPVDSVYSKIVDNFIVDDYGNRLCKVEHGHHEFWRVAYLDCPLEGKIGDEISKFELLGTELANGIDFRFGILVHLWTIKKYKEYDLNGATLQGKLITITEPGNKIRPLTSGESWAYLYLVPAAHFLTELISLLPGARVGLTDSDGLYRMGASFNRHFGKLEDDELGEYISTSDLESATDFANRDISRAMLKGLVHQLRQAPGPIRIPETFKQYLDNAIDLLCSDRLISLKMTNRLMKATKQYQITSEHKEASFLFGRGVLMGDPITKVVLSASSIGANYAVLLGFKGISDVKREQRTPLKTRKGSAYACAGDDHTAVGDFKYCKAIPTFLESMGYRISWPKYRISKKYVHYCQDFGVHPKYARRIKVDTIKVRLLNQFAKMGLRTQFESPDPLRGKMKELERLIRFIEEDFEQGESPWKPMIADSILPKFKETLPLMLRLAMPKFFEKKVANSMVTYMPTKFGGIGVPSKFSFYYDKTALLVARVKLFSSLTEREETEINKFKTTWERGIDSRTTTFNFLSVYFEDPYSVVEDVETVFSRVTSELSFNSKAGPPSKRRVNRKMLDEYVDLSKPNTLLGTKEVPYVSMIKGNGLLAKVKPKSRTSHYIRQTVRNAHDYQKRCPEVLDMEFSWDSIPGRLGLMISRQRLLEILEVKGNAPSLFLRKNFFRGKLELSKSLCSDPVPLTSASLGEL